MKVTPMVRLSIVAPQLISFSAAIAASASGADSCNSEENGPLIASFQGRSSMNYDGRLSSNMIQEGAYD